MLIDEQNQFCALQALTITAASTNYVDLGAAAANKGLGEPMCVSLELGVAAAGGDSFAVAVQVDDNTGFTFATSVASATITSGDAQGKRYVINIPNEISKLERYMRLYFTRSGACTATVSAELMPLSMVDQWTTFPSGFAIAD